MTSVTYDRPEASDRLPLSPLLALAMTGFTAIMTETLPAGLLTQIADGFAVSPAMAGQLVTTYAVGSLLSAIPLTSATQGWRRKPTLLLAIVGLLVFNTATAIASSYWLALVARLLAGVAAGLAWGIIAGYARRMVADPLKGRALAIAMVGTPIALSLGMPAGTWLGAIVGWRTAFLAMSATTLVLIAWVLLAVPDFAGRAPGQRLSTLAVVQTPGILSILATIFAWMTAHNILYTFIAPFAVRAGLGAHLDLLLLLFGAAALVAIWCTGRLVDRMLRTLLLTSLAAFGGVALLFGIAGTSAPVAIIGVALWGLTFGGAATLLQTASADAAGEGVDIASAMVTTVWNAAIATGGLTGGVLLDRSGAGAFAWAILPMIAAAFFVAAAAHRSGFRPGSRTHHRLATG